MYGNMTLEVSCSESWDGGVGGWGVQCFVWGCSAPRPNSFTLLYLYIFYSKGYTFHLPSQEQCIPFQNPGSEVNEQHYGRS